MKQKTKNTTIFVITVIVSIFVLLIVKDIQMQNVLEKHGYHDLQTKPRLTQKQLDYAIKNTPEKFTGDIKDIKENSIIILYKFDCPHCHAVYPKVKEIVDKNKDNYNFYYISAPSKVGQEIVKEFQTQTVPMVILYNKEHKWRYDLGGINTENQLIDETHRINEIMTKIDELKKQ